MILTLEEAIAREEDIVAENERFCAVAPPEITASAYHSATYHRQIAEWLKELAGRKTGKWIFGETLGHSWMKCSECCVSQSGHTSTFTYCPNCGAKMEVDDD